MGADSPLAVLASPAHRNLERNPYNHLLYAHVEATGVRVAELTRQALESGQYDVWHFHWPEHYLNGPNRQIARMLLRFVYFVAVAKIRGTALVWTAHNLQSHDGHHPLLGAALRRFMILFLDGWISLSASGRGAAARSYPRLTRRRSFVIPHGHYRGWYADDVDSDAARRRLDVAASAPIIAFVGLIRPYKGVDRLLRAFAGLHDPQARLLIAGRAEPPAEGQRMAELAAADARVRMYCEFIPDDELQVYFRAADLIVLPFREILNSGSGILALSFDRPLLVPRIGAMSELAEAVGDEWVRTYDGELTADTLADALEWAREVDRGDRAPLGALEWKPIAEATVAAYKQVLISRRRGSTQRVHGSR